MLILTNYSLLLTFGFLSIFSINPIHCILNLIGLFFSSTIFIVILKLLYIGLIFLAVYLGAIAILFLFIVMMIDVKLSNDVNNYVQNWKFFDFFFIIFLLILFFIDNTSLENLSIIKNYISTLTSSGELLTSSSYIHYNKFLSLIFPRTFLQGFSEDLFQQQAISFLECGFILFIGMVGAIVLTVEPINQKFLFNQDPGLQSNYKRSINLIN